MENNLDNLGKILNILAPPESSSGASSGNGTQTENEQVHIRKHLLFSSSTTHILFPYRISAHCILVGNLDRQFAGAPLFNKLDIQKLCLKYGRDMKWGEGDNYINYCLATRLFVSFSFF